MPEHRNPDETFEQRVYRIFVELSCTHGKVPTAAAILDWAGMYKQGHAVKDVQAVLDKAHGKPGVLLKDTRLRRRNK